MHEVTLDTIDHVLDLADNWSEDDVQKIVGQMSDEQPLYMAYLIMAGGDSLSEDEQELTFYFGTLTWYMMHRQKGAPLAEATEAIFEAVDHESAAWVDLLAEESSPSEIPDELIDHTTQPFLLQFLVAAVESSVEEGEFSLKHANYILILLKKGLDALTEAERRAAA